MTDALPCAEQDTSQRARHDLEFVCLLPEAGRGFRGWGFDGPQPSPCCGVALGVPGDWLVLVETGLPRPASCARVLSHGGCLVPLTDNNMHKLVCHVYPQVPVPHHCLGKQPPYPTEHPAASSLWPHAWPPAASAPPGLYRTTAHFHFQSEVIISLPLQLRHPAAAHHRTTKPACICGESRMGLMVFWRINYSCSKPQTTTSMPPTGAQVDRRNAWTRIHASSAATLQCATCGRP